MPRGAKYRERLDAGLCGECGQRARFEGQTKCRECRDATQQVAALIREADRGGRPPRSGPYATTSLDAAYDRGKADAAAWPGGVAAPRNPYTDGSGRARSKAALEYARGWNTHFRQGEPGYRELRPRPLYVRSKGSNG